MSRHRRLHIPGGTYYVAQSGSAHQPVFSQPDDYSLFERLLGTAVRRTGARVHAYCWTAQSIHLLLQIEDVSVGRFMQGLTSRYARSMQQRAGESGHFFRHRYRAVLIDPQEYQLRLVHYIHHVPVLEGLAQSIGTHAFTSHGAYLHSSVIPWLTTRTTLQLLEEHSQETDYAALMQRAPAPRDVDLFRRVGSSDLRVIGGPEFMEGLPRHSRTYRSKASLDQIIQTVTCMLGVEREHVLSSSRRREFTLARALIGWYATERGVATLTEVARRLRRDPSTLSLAISRYRACRPELFKLTALHDIVPLAPIGFLVRTEDWCASTADREPSDDNDRKIASG